LIYTPSPDAFFFINVAPLENPESPVGTTFPEAITICSAEFLTMTSLLKYGLNAFKKSISD